MKIENKIYYFLFLIAISFTQIVFSQSEIKESILNQNVKELMNSNPEQAINITKLLLSKPSITAAEKAKINFLSAKIYKVKGDYSNSLKFLYEEKKYLDYLTDYEKLTIDLEKIAVLRELSLDKEAKEILSLIENNNEYAANKNLKTIKDASVTLEKANFLLKEQNYNKGIELLNNELQKSNNLKNYPELALSYTIALGELYLENRNLEISKSDFKKALQIINENKNNNNYEKIFALSGLASVYFQEKEHDQAIAILKEAYNNSIGLQNIYLQELIINNLSINYLALNDTLNYKLSNVNFIQKNVEIEKLEQEAINTAYNLISENQSDKHIKQQSNYYKIIYVIIALCILFICFLLLVWWQLFQKKKRLKEIINYLNITRNNFISQINVKVEETKKISIPKETEQLLLKKLEKFGNSNRFTNKDISLSVLAGQLDTNTKYLSEVINSNFNMNFNTYINKLRINYIVEKLRNEPNYMNYKISYLADNCGFSSHSSFATVFKTITGISPVTFIDLLRKEKENLPTDDLQ